MVISALERYRQEIPEGLVIGGPFAYATNPPDPPEGTYVIWMALGSNDDGDHGDLMIKATSGGVTKTAVLLNFSAA